MDVIDQNGSTPLFYAVTLGRECQLDDCAFKSGPNFANLKCQVFRNVFNMRPILPFAI